MEWRGGADKLLLPFDWQVLQDYVALVDDAELRIALAQKHKCHDIVINVRTLGVCFNLSDWPILTEGLFISGDNQTYRDLKDRQQLLGYRAKVERGSAEQSKIDQLLANQVGMGDGRDYRRRGSECGTIRRWNYLDIPANITQSIGLLANPVEELRASLRDTPDLLSLAAVDLDSAHRKELLLLLTVVVSHSSMFFYKYVK